MFFVSNLQSYSQAGRRGCESRLPLHLFIELRAIWDSPPIPRYSVYSIKPISPILTLILAFEARRLRSSALSRGSLLLDVRTGVDIYADAEPSFPQRGPRTSVRPPQGSTSLAGGRAEARRRLKSAPPSKRSPASGGPKWLTLFPRANRNCGATSGVSETHLDPLRERHPPSRSAEKSLRPRGHPADTSFPNYPKSPADIRSSDGDR